MHLDIRDFGRGRHTSINPSLIAAGAARDSLNLLHNEGTSTALLRNAYDRVWATRPANAVTLLAYELVKTDITAVRLTKVGTVLYSFVLAPGTNPTSLLTGLAANFQPSVATVAGLAFVADSGKNYITDGTADHTHELQKAGAQGTATLANRVGTAVGNTAATISYYITDMEPTTGEETPPNAAVTIARLADEGVAITVLTYTGHFTSKRIYRNKAGGTQPYLVTTLTGSTASYNDDSLDTALTTTSTVHTSAGAASIEKPEAAEHAAAFKGRLFLASKNRLWWSKPLEPTQFGNTSSSELEIGKDDGDEITGVVPFRGSFVVFKNFSIWVLNGDSDETTFTIYQAVVGVGCRAPRTIRADGDRRLLFLGNDGIHSFDLSSAVKVSDAVDPDFSDMDFATYADYMCAGLEPGTRQYLCSVTPSGQTTNTETHVVNLDTGAWSRREVAMNVVKPSCYSDTTSRGAIRNTLGAVKLYMGSTDGYLYETDTSTGADGVTSGTKEATVTSSTASTTTATAAAFRTTGNGLTGLSMTLRRAADATYETVTITSATATVITHGSWTGTAPVADDTIYIGAIQATLSLGRITLGDVQRKYWRRLEVGFKKQTATTPLRVGYTLDEDTAPTASREYAMNNNNFARLPIPSVGRSRAIGLSVYLDLIGVSHGFDLISLALELDIFATWGPAR